MVIISEFIQWVGQKSYTTKKTIGQAYQRKIREVSSPTAKNQRGGCAHSWKNKGDGRPHPGKIREVGRPIADKMREMGGPTQENKGGGQAHNR